METWILPVKGVFWTKQRGRVLYYIQIVTIHTVCWHRQYYSIKLKLAYTCMELRVLLKLFFFNRIFWQKFRHNIILFLHHLTAVLPQFQQEINQCLYMLIIFNSNGDRHHYRFKGCKFWSVLCTYGRWAVRVFLACHTNCDIWHPFTWSSPRTRDTHVHLLPSV